MELMASDDPVGYQHALRVIGRYLDSEPAYHVTVVEVDDGFTVRYSPTRHRAEQVTARFPWTRLRDLRVFNTAARGRGPRPGRYAGLRAEVPGGYQDFLRALGAMLDDSRAAGLSLDALPGGMAVSYLREQPDNPFQAEKYYSILDRSKMEDILSEGLARRITNVTPFRS
ncbi:MAG: hypothetical protein ACRDFS_08245 [Chloroflexota bacterium]